MSRKKGVLTGAGETRKHREVVRKKLGIITRLLNDRKITHDASKLSEPEKNILEEITSKLKETTYGSKDYFSNIIETFRKHHYAVNSHHPEHFENGISGMTLIDLVEMFADWVSAIQRHADGDFYKSIKINEDRFSMDPQLISIFKNTFEKHFKEV